MGPVTGLAASSDELVGIKDHDLVLVRLMDQYAVNRRCVGGHYRELVTHQTEHALHFFPIPISLPQFTVFLSLCDLACLGEKAFLKKLITT